MKTNTITINAYKDTDGDGKADQNRVVFQKDDYRDGGCKYGAPTQRS
jgi:hypothetical protein